MSNKYFASIHMENDLNRTQHSWGSYMCTYMTLFLPEDLMFNQFWKVFVLISGKKILIHCQLILLNSDFSGENSFLNEM